MADKRLADYPQKRPPNEDTIIRLGNAMLEEAGKNGASPAEIVHALVAVFGEACDTVLRLAEEHGGTEIQKLATLRALLDAITAGATVEMTSRVVVQEQPS